jgi:hypothetical protein
VCDADAEFGVSVAIGNGHIYDLVGCGGNADLRPTEAPRRAASGLYRLLCTPCTSPTTDGTNTRALSPLLALLLTFVLSDDLLIRDHQRSSHSEVCSALTRASSLEPMTLGEHALRTGAAGARSPRPAPRSCFYSTSSHVSCRVNSFGNATVERMLEDRITLNSGGR